MTNLLKWKEQVSLTITKHIIVIWFLWSVFDVQLLKVCNEMMLYFLHQSFSVLASQMFMYAFVLAIVLE